MISALQHPNLVRLYGCCIEKNQLLLVYEYMENNSLELNLFEKEENELKLDWPMRQRICIGIAKGLAFLHEESILKIVHRDIKAANILLDKYLNPKDLYSLSLRPTMSEVVKMLEGRAPVPEFVKGPSIYGDALGALRTNSIII